MGYPAAPTESGGARIHFGTTDGNVAAGWFAVDTGVTATGTNVVGFLAIATHVHDDAAGAPGGLATGGIPLVLVGGVRDDALVSLTPAEGDAVHLLVDEYGALWTHDNVLGAALAGSELQVDIVTMPATAADGAGLPGVFVVVAGDDGVDTHPLQVDASGFLKMSLEVDNVGIGGGTQYAVDVALGATPTGTLAIAIRDDTLNALGPAEGDAIGLRVDGVGALWVHDTALEAALAGNELQVDIVAPLPTGSNAIGKLAANTGVDIGSVAILSVPAPLSTTGGGTEATALRVTIANNSTGVLTVDGTVTAELSATDNAVLDTIDAVLDAIKVDTAANKTAVEIIAAAVAAGQMQVDIVAPLPAGTNAIGKLAANDGVDIGNVDVASITDVTMSNAAMQITGDEAHDAPDAGNPVKFGGRAQSPWAQPDEVADNDRVDALLDQNGYLRVRGDFDPQFADINDSSSGDNTIVAAPAAGKRIAVWSYFIVADGTVDVRWEDGAGGTPITGQVPLQAREGWSSPAGGLVPLFVCSAAALLNLELSAAVNVHGSVSYTVIDD